jgi:hypothetical protein
MIQCQTMLLIILMQHSKKSNDHLQHPEMVV